MSTLKYCFDHVDDSVMANGDENFLFVAEHNIHQHIRELKKRGTSADCLFELIKDEPDIDNLPIYAYVAGFTEWLAREYDIQVPDWVFSERAFALKDFFLPTRHSSQGIMKCTEESPVEMASRGYYIKSKDFNIY